jgi:hypothetical protein
VLLGKDASARWFDAEGLWHQLELEDIFELSNQPDAVGFQFGETDFLACVVLEPPQARQVIWTVETAGS